MTHDAHEASRLEDKPITVIQRQRRWRSVDLKALWRSRELIAFLVWRDVKIRYKQTELGILWAVIQPLATTGVFAILFGLLMGPGKEPGVEGVPYILSTFCAMLPWQIFSESLTRSANCLVDGRQLVTKVYFPRAGMPTAATMVSVFDFGIRLILLVLLMAWFRQVPTLSILAFPLFFLLTVMLAVGASLWISALSAVYYDFRYAMPFFTQIGFYASPVVYATSKLTDAAPSLVNAVYSMNPMVAVIEGFRWTLLGSPPPCLAILVPSVVTTLFMFVGGLFFFRRMERVIVDVI
jgi:lipopolysaccharide transport system permease protein